MTWIGRFVNELDFKTVADDKKVLNSRIALRTEAGKQDVFSDIVAWGPTAEYLNKYYKKGYEIMFTGKLINMEIKHSENLTIKTLGIQIDRVIPTYGNPNVQVPENDKFKGFLEG